MIEDGYTHIVTLHTNRSGEEIKEAYEREGIKVVFIKRIPWDKKTVYVALQGRRKTEGKTA